MGLAAVFRADQTDDEIWLTSGGNREFTAAVGKGTDAAGELASEFVLGRFGRLVAHFAEQSAFAGLRLDGFLAHLACARKEQQLFGGKRAQAAWADDLFRRAGLETSLPIWAQSRDALTVVAEGDAGVRMDDEDLRGFVRIERVSTHVKALPTAAADFAQVDGVVMLAVVEPARSAPGVKLERVFVAGLRHSFVVGREGEAGESTLGRMSDAPGEFEFAFVLWIRIDAIGEGCPWFPVDGRRAAAGVARRRDPTITV